MIVTGCERSGTTIVAQIIAEQNGLEYIHEGFGEGLMKHSLNLNQNIKHLELLDHLFPDSRWYWVQRDPVQTIRSLHQKVWQRLPHTMSLDDCIQQYIHVNKSCKDFVLERGEIAVYEEYVDNPVVKDYFTDSQTEYINIRLNNEL